MARNKPILIKCLHCGREEYKYSKRAVYCNECVKKYSQDYLYYWHRMKPNGRNNEKMRKYFNNNPLAMKKQSQRVKAWMKRKDLYSLENRRNNFPENIPQT